MSDIMDRLLDTTDRDAVSDAREEIAALRAEVERLKDIVEQSRDLLNAAQLTRDEENLVLALTARDTGIKALRAENERLKKEALFTAISVLPEKDAENERLRAALRGMIDNACAACDEDYVIRATKKEWDAHVNATAKARAALEGKQ